MAWQALVEADAPFLIELRPVYTEDPPAEWGIRSQRFRLDESGAHLIGSSPSVRVTPDVLAAATVVSSMSDSELRRLKTWLGYRYNRPAVPQRLIALAQELANQLTKKRHRDRASRVRDVLAQFELETDGTTTYELVAVLPGQPAEDSKAVIEARTWLSDAAEATPAELGVAKRLDAYGDEEVSLAFVEGSFSLDISKLSWPPNTPGPTGAV